MFINLLSRTLLVLVLLTTTLFSQSAPKAFAPIDPFAQVKKMQRGVNVIGYDPLWKNSDNARFKASHFKIIHEGGFNTIRVNLQAFQHMDAANRLDPAWLKTLDWVVSNALANDLIVILDEHDYNFCGKDPLVCRNKLLAFWEQVAPRYKDSPNTVLFEILNEPNAALTTDGWNLLLNEALTVIRRTNPERNVVIGPSFWNSIHQLDTLKLPENDRHIIATVHYYSPMEFTHQGAAWNKETATLSGVKWGTDVEKQKVVQDFSDVQQWSQKNQRPILLGEFGAYDKAAVEDRVKYTSFIARTAESMNWAWTYWQFDSDFILWDMKQNDWVQPIHKALIP